MNNIIKIFIISILLTSCSKQILQPELDVTTYNNTVQNYTDEHYIVDNGTNAQCFVDCVSDDIQLCVDGYNEMIDELEANNLSVWSDIELDQYCKYEHFEYRSEYCNRGC